ncbi:MAG: ABC transporter ATP-binding protein [bacterium]|nr:ABC transporter ATP-binding protein [bacterium]
MNNYAVKVDNVFKSFKDETKNKIKKDFLSALFSRTQNRFYAVNGVSFAIDYGEIFGILGQNGSGKSTLIRMISTLLTLEKGSISVFGYDIVKDEYKVKQHINRVTVEASFFKKLSAFENLMYAASIYGVPRDEAKSRINEILGVLNLDLNRIHEPLENFSRGMQQKVAIGRAVLTSPSLLLLDEPTTGLDPKSKKDVQSFILKVRKTNNTTVILTTHDMEEADRICDRIAIIDKGKFITLNTPANLKNKFRKENETISLEDVFFEITGKEFKSDELEE